MTNVSISTMVEQQPPNSSTATAFLNSLDFSRHFTVSIRFPFSITFPYFIKREFLPHLWSSPSPPGFIILQLRIQVRQTEPVFYFYLSRSLFFFH